MHDLHPENIKQTASRQLDRSQGGPRVLLVFCGILLALCLAITGGSYILDSMMASAGGLGGLTKRTMIQTFQNLLPIVNTVAMLILELGLWNAMLRISRGQYVSPQSLKRGLSRFFPWLRCTLLQALIYVTAGIALANISMIIFFATPFSRKALELTVPLAMKTSDPMVLMELLMEDEALLMSLFDAVIPMYIIFGVLALAAFLPVAYRLRLANLVILDDPTAGAFKGLFTSFRLTRGNWKHFVKLDLSFWWYYVLLALSMALNYTDVILAMIGRPLPMSATAGSLLAYGLYLVTQVALFYFLRPKVQVSTALLYDAIRPKEEAPKNTVVLGNIFQM